MPPAADAPADVPTAIPTETAIPTMTPTPEPTIDPQEMAYHADILEVFGGCNDAMVELMNVSREASDNSYIIFDDGWRIRAAVMLNQCADDLAAERYVPERFREAHGKLVEAGEELSLVADLWTEGVGGLDPEKTAQASYHLQIALDRLNESNTLFEAIQK